MSDRKCPLCGKDVVEGESFCRDCQDIAQYSYPAGFIDADSKNIAESSDKESTIEVDVVTEQNEEGQPKQILPIPKKSNKSLIFIIIGLIACVSIGGIGAYTFTQNKEAQETEAAYWAKCSEENTPLSYSKYLVQYPEGKYSTEAQNKIVELRNKERQDWADLQKSTDINTYFSFLADHPNTPYEREIRQRMDSLSWINTAKENTAASYLAYMENVKLGNFSGEYEGLAKERYDYLSQLKTVDGDELVAVKKIITDLLKNLSAKKYKDLQKQMAPTLENFFGIENETREAIISSIQTTMKNQKIKDIVYTSKIDLAEVIKDNKGIYFVSVPISKEVIYSNRKKKKELSSFSANIELTEKKELKSLYQKK